MDSPAKRNWHVSSGNAFVAIKRFIKKELPYVAIAGRAAINRAKSTRSRFVIRRLLKERKKLLLEIGAGDKKGAGGWITLDMTEHCDIFWDLRNGLPFPDDSISKIYSSHFLEHLSFRESQQLLGECRRTLIPGGVFSICVPDAKLYLEAYFNLGSLDRNKAFGWKPAYNKTTQIDFVNYIAYMDGEHKYMFDKENLLFILELQGFRNARLRKFDQSIDLPERDFESIYAEAEK